MRRASLWIVLALAAAALPGPSPAARDRSSAFSWTGSWNTNWGLTRFVQTGSSVSGSFPGGGEIEATSSGPALYGTWDGTVPRLGPGTLTGTGTFSVGASGNDLFAGRWHGEGQNGIWSGTRVGAITPKQGSKVAFSFSGSCAASPCGSQAEEASASVSGSGTVSLKSSSTGGGTGTATGTASVSLVGSTRDPAATGTGRLIFTGAQYTIQSNGDRDLYLDATVTGTGSCPGGADGKIDLSIEGKSTLLFVDACGIGLTLGSIESDPLTLTIGNATVGPPATRSSGSATTATSAPTTTTNPTATTAPTTTTAPATTTSAPPTTTAPAAPAAGQLVAGKHYTVSASTQTTSFDATRTFAYQGSDYTPAEVQATLSGGFTYVIADSQKSVSGSATVDLTLRRVEGSGPKELLLPLKFRLVNGSDNSTQGAAISFNAVLVGANNPACAKAYFTPDSSIDALAINICGGVVSDAGGARLSYH